MKQIQTTPHILIMGAEGMLGRAVYHYLKLNYPNSVWGTTSNSYNRSFLKFRVERQSKDFRIIFKKIKKIDYVINCIAIINQKDPIENLIRVNGLFPHFLENEASKLEFKLIHVSSDGVFSHLCGKVSENSKPNPDNIYGMSKLLGETNSKNALAIRTSILGLKSKNSNALLEWALKQKNKKVNGYVNQLWTGCTTLQFSKLCEWIIFRKKFSQLRNFSNVVHFSPLKSSKHNILKSFSFISKTPFKLKKVTGERITRQLTSNFFDLSKLKMYTVKIHNALKELVYFENEIKYEK